MPPDKSFLKTASSHLGSQMSFLPNWTAKGDALITPSELSTAITSFAPVRKLLSAETEMETGRRRMRVGGNIRLVPTDPFQQKTLSLVVIAPTSQLD